MQLWARNAFLGASVIDTADLRCLPQALCRSSGYSRSRVGQFMKSGVLFGDKARSLGIPRQSCDGRRQSSLSAAAYRGNYPAQQIPGSSRVQQYPSRYSPRAPEQPVQRQLGPSQHRQGRRNPPRRILPPPEDEPTLSCQQVTNKQVITRTSGISLGFIKHLCTDPDTLTVVSAELRPKALGWSAAPRENLLLETFCQIGDVVLVHDEGALDFVPQDETLGFLDLIGCPVYNSMGEWLGKVREYTFSPDSGRVDLIKFDPLGWPAVPEKLTGAWQIGVERVEVMDGNRIYLMPRAEEQMMRVSDGPLEAALLSLQSLYQDTGTSDVAEGGIEADYEYEKWKRLYGQAFADAFGQAPPATRSELDNFYMGMEAAQQAKAVPQSLPPGRQPAVSEAIRASGREREMARVRAAPPAREDLRMRRRGATEPLQRPRQQPPLRAQPPEGATAASVSIIDRRPPSGRRRNADGRLGDDQLPAEPSGKIYDDWFDRSLQKQTAAQMSSSRGYAAPGGWGSQTWEGREPQSFDEHRGNPRQLQWSPDPHRGRSEEREQVGKGNFRASPNLGAAPRDAAGSSRELRGNPRGEESIRDAIPQTGNEGNSDQRSRDQGSGGASGADRSAGYSAARERTYQESSRGPQRGPGEAVVESVAADSKPGSPQAMQRERDAFWRESGNGPGAGNGFASQEVPLNQQTDRQTY